MEMRVIGMGTPNYLGKLRGRDMSLHRVIMYREFFQFWGYDL
jgi:hypothetical protein